MACAVQALRMKQAGIVMSTKPAVLRSAALAAAAAEAELESQKMQAALEMEKQKQQEEQQRCVRWTAG
jgi:hypothetical protein